MGAGVEEIEQLYISAGAAHERSRRRTPPEVVMAA